MRRILYAAALAFTVSACTPLPSAPVEVADTTLLDEKAGQGVELAYKAFRTALEVATDAGLLTGANASRAADADKRAYSAVLSVRAAYRTGNASTYANALTEAYAAIDAAVSTVKGN